MPGLNQLKEFSNDIKQVGDEVKIRAQRGEKPVEVPLPVGISEEDDSDDFLLGMPDAENADSVESLEAADGGMSVEDVLAAINSESNDSAPDLDSLLNPQNSDDVPDLSDFSDDLSFPEDLSSDAGTPAETVETSATEDLGIADIGGSSETSGDFDLSSLDSLDSLDSFDTSALDTPDSFDASDILENSEPVETVETTEPVDAGESFDTSDFADILEAPSESENTGIADGLEDLNSDFETSDGGIDLNADLPEELLMEDGVGTASETPAVEETPADMDFSTPDFDALDASSENTEALTSDFDTSALDNLDAVSDSASDLSMFDTAGLDDLGSPDAADAPASSPEMDFSTLDFDAPAASPETDFSTPDFDAPATSTETDFSTPDFDAPATSSETDFSTPDFDAPAASSEMDFSTPDFDAPAASTETDFSTPDFDFGSLDAGNGEIPDASMEVPGDDSFTSETESEPVPETFDISEMDGMDFTPATPAGGSEEFPVTGEAPVDDFVLDSDFAIPGFSDTETADLSKKNSSLDTVDFSLGKPGRPKNTLTDEEYKQFRVNLAAYPLNLRLAVEDFIAKNEFTDDAVFEVIEKILKKTSARQVATQLEKMLDISINIPRDFEKRSYAQYEAYKQSFQYQLKNRIIPAAIAGIVLCFVCIGLFKASMKFIYNPVMASMNYKQGYTLLENNEFPQSEDKFKEAVSYKPVKKWFFKYAKGYREKKQFDRAANMYKNTLKYFNHDLNAGLEYAQMELYDRANYEMAESIVRREILDYHINNPDGLLLLGDTFLEWAEVDEGKFELAKNQYLDLIQRFGETNVYLSRMLRYYIRTDKLREVLVYKNIFYPNAKSLSSSDWTELSGYLLDKLYGELSLNDEYLRASIEDVRAMLEIAVKSDHVNPVARYNLARYFVFNGYTEQAKSELEVSLDLFDKAAIRTKKNVYKEINASRILGELYASNREYLKAQTVYTRGVDLFNSEHESTGLEGDFNTGKLFANLGDIDYFISGELDGALYNYEKAIEIKNDTPSLNYRVGAIYYGREDYDKALASFIKVSEADDKDINVLLALGNVLALRNDNFAAQSYYSDLLASLDMEKAKRKILLPQEDEDEGVIMEMYLRANNNMGVTLYKTARQTGNSQMNAKAMVCLTDSMRAWDSLTRNPRTMIRMEGSNLAAQNSKYITHPHSDFEPAIYTDIPKILSNEKIME